MKRALVKRCLAFLFAATLLVCACACSRVQTPQADKTLNLSGMELVFEENFDGPLDATRWRTTRGEGARRGGYWDPAQCFTQDGNLIIRTEYKEDGPKGSGWYTGTCTTDGLQEFTYGYFEARCKAPAAGGLWSAFWLQSETMGDETEGGKNGAEIDVMESPYYNDPKKDTETYRNTTMHTIHIDGYGDKHQSKGSGEFRVDRDMYNEFNTYGVLWTPDEYVFYINGQETWRTDFGVSQSPEFLLLTVEIAGKDGSADPDNQNNRYSWSGDIRDNPEGTFPVDFVVDYVRVYQFA